MVFNNSTFERLRGLPVLACLRTLRTQIKADRSYIPSTAIGTQRVHVAVAHHDWEPLLDESKFYDTRGRAGRGVGTDLVMHLGGVPFKAAMKVLVEAGL